MHRFTRHLTALLLSLTIGLHWGVLQSVAWTTMIIRRSQTTPLKEAIRTTLDGQHPCQLCKAIQKGKATEEKSAPQPKAPKLALPRADRMARDPEPRLAFSTPLEAVFRCVTRSVRPPSPPPRPA